MKTDYSNLREVLKQALECESPQVFIRALLGYVKDDNFWTDAKMEDLQLVNSLLETLLEFAESIAAMNAA